MPTITARIDDETQNRLETLSKATERSRSWLVADAVKRYIDDENWQIEAIEEALTNKEDSVKLHLQSAINLYAKRPEGEYRNSIKESISAIEALCRKITGENTLGKALSKLEKNGLILPSVLKKSLVTKCLAQI